MVTDKIEVSSEDSDTKKKFRYMLTDQEKLERVIYRQLMVKHQAKKLLKAFEDVFPAKAELIDEFNDAFSALHGKGYLFATNLELDHDVIQNRQLRRSAKTLQEYREWFLSDLALYYDNAYRRDSKTLLNGAMLAGGIVAFGLTASFYFPAAIIVSLILACIVMAVAAWMKFYGGEPDTSLERYGITPEQYSEAQATVLSRFNSKQQEKTVGDAEAHHSDAESEVLELHDDESLSNSVEPEPGSVRLLRNFWSAEPSDDAFVHDDDDDNQYQWWMG